MTRQYTLTLKIVLDSLRLIFNYSDEIRKDTKYIGMVVNSLRKEIVKYLLKVSTRATGPDSKVLLTYTVITDDIASIAKHADNILDLSRINARNRTDFSAAAKAELNEIGELVKSNLELVLELNAQTPGGGREIAEKILLQENTIDRLVQEAREKHSERFHQHTCQAESAPIFIEILINMERISDHCENIAQYFLEYRNQGVRTGKLLASEKAE